MKRTGFWRLVWIGWLVVIGATACGESCKREHCSNEFGFDYATGQYKMVYVCVCLDDVEVTP